MADTVVRCPDCGTRQIVEPEDAGRPLICWRCDARFAAPEPPRVYRRRRPLPPAVSPAAVLSLALGVVSCAVACVWPVTLFTSVAGLVTAAYGVGTPSRPVAVAGGVLSAVGLIFAVGFLVLTVAGVSVFDADANAPPTPFFPPR